MLHLDRGCSWVDSDGVRDEISLTVAPDRDYVGKLEEGPENFFPETEVPL